MLPSSVQIQNSPDALIREFLAGKNYSQVGVLVDDNTKTHCYSLLQPGLSDHQLFEIPAGEEHKNVHTCLKVWDQLTKSGFDRHSLLIILGGGVLGDLGGFCAATYKRGIDFMLMPTTLLAQVDASIGGKLGVDFDNIKNHIGLFQLPIATFICHPFLMTLPKRELRSGFAEIIKHCLISDRAMWERISVKSLEGQSWGELVQHSVEFKYSVIEKDPRESGLRKILNFGHSIGHAVEGDFLASGNRIFHGEAIAIGMIAESWIAREKKLISSNELEQIRSYLMKIFGPFPSLGADDALLGRMAQDKKNRGNKVLMALPKGIGNAVWDIEVSTNEIVASLNYFRSIQT